MAIEMPSISSLFEKFTSGSASPPVQLASEAPVDESSGKGGTTSAPVDAAIAPDAPAASTEDAKAIPAPEKTADAPVAPKKDLSSSRFAALSRKEKEIRQQSQEIETRAKAAEAREAALQEKESRWNTAKKRPLQALKELGFNYSDVTQEVLGNFKEAEADPMDVKLNPLKEKWDKFEPQVEALTRELTALKESMSKKEQQASYDEAMTNIRDTAAASPEKYELIGHFGEEAHGLIKDVIVEYWKNNEKMLDYSEACDIVEQYYEKEYLEKLLNTKKMKSRLPAPEAAPSKPKPAPKEAKESTTLTNSLTTGSGAKVDLDKMSKQDAIAYLAKRLQFKDS